MHLRQQLLPIAGLVFSGLRALLCHIAVESSNFPRQAQMSTAAATAALAAAVTIAAAAATTAGSH